MNNAFKKGFQLACGVLVLTAAVSFADEPEKKEGDKCCPARPSQISCCDCSKECGKSDKKGCDKDKDCSSCSSCPDSK
jgi:hypothetical protein